MKISILVINIALVLSLAIPIIWLILLGIRGTKKTEKKLKNLSEKYKMSFTSEEIWNDNFIGINEQDSVLLFIQLTDSEPVYSIINLDEIASCRLVDTTKYFMEGKNKISLLEKIDLELTSIYNKEHKSLNFFNIDINYNQNLELMRARKWEAIIKKNIHRSVITKKAS
ncbi:MAG: hypothetical protein KJO83_03410 [Bacteroidia bacterium]|nr:hypothetical protein [Bacteroidia bacterium]